MYLEALAPLGEMEFICTTDTKTFKLNGHNPEETASDPAFESGHYYIR
jgi:hypothetical protein